MIYVTIKYPSMSIGLVVVSFKYTVAHLSIKAERTPGSFPLAFFQSLFSCDPLGMLRWVAFPEAFHGGFQIYIFFFLISKCTVNACQIPGRLCNCRTYKSIFLRKLQRLCQIWDRFLRSSQVQVDYTHIVVHHQKHRTLTIAILKQLIANRKMTCQRLFPSSGGIVHSCQFL